LCGFSLKLFPAEGEVAGVESKQFLSIAALHDSGGPVVLAGRLLDIIDGDESPGLTFLELIAGISLEDSEGEGLADGPNESFEKLFIKDNDLGILLSYNVVHRVGDLLVIPNLPITTSLLLFGVLDLFFLL